MSFTGLAKSAGRPVEFAPPHFSVDRSANHPAPSLLSGHGVFELLLEGVGPDLIEEKGAYFLFPEGEHHLLVEHPHSLQPGGIGPATRGEFLIHEPYRVLPLSETCMHIYNNQAVAANPFALSYQACD